MTKRNTLEALFWLEATVVFTTVGYRVGRKLGEALALRTARAIGML